MNYAIVGCGLIGKKRLAALPSGSRLEVACDTDAQRAAELAAAGSGRAMTDYKAAVADSRVEVVIVATINRALPEVAAAAIRAGKHVLVEKPVAFSVSEIDALIDLATRHNVRVRVGFNHRFHPAFLKAREICAAGLPGELMFIRARYGHGGRVGYDQEWRANPQLSGGGELIDQGVHLIDLAGWFLGAWNFIDGHAGTYFWKMPVDDNAFIHLRTAEGKTAWLHASCTEWKNLFSFEIYGRHAKLQIEGLGKSYGPEKLYHYQMKPEMGPPDTVLYEFDGPDESWRAELMEFEEDIRLSRASAAGLREARATIEVVQTIYKKCGFDFHSAP